MHELEQFIQTTADVVAEKMQSGAELEAQLLIVKTANNPELLQRFLKNSGELLAVTTVPAQVIIGVLDESCTEAHRTDTSAVVAQAKHSIPNLEYTTTKNLHEEAWLKKLLYILESELGYAGVAALYFLLTENIKNAPIKTFPRHAATITEFGGGPIASTNCAFLYGAFLAGKYNYELSKVSITHNDDDIVYKTTEQDESGLPALALFDYFSFRHEALKERLVTMSKYIGVKGSPASTIESCLRVVLGTLENLKNSVSTEFMSQHLVFDAANYRYRSHTVGEIKKILPEIISTALQRTPIAGHVMREGLEKISSAHSRFDMGNFTLAYPIFSTLPFPPVGVPEYILPSFLSQIQKSDAAELEPPIFHHRTNADCGNKRPLSNVTDKNALVQCALENVAGQSLGFAHGARSFFEVKLAQLQRIRTLRDFLSLSRSEIEPSQPEAAEAISTLLQEVAEDTLQRIEEEIRGGISERYITKGIQRYIQAASRWEEIVKATWKLGVNSK